MWVNVIQHTYTGQTKRKKEKIFRCVYDKIFYICVNTNSLCKHKFFVCMVVVGLKFTI